MDRIERRWAEQCLSESCLSVSILSILSEVMRWGNSATGGALRQRKRAGPAARRTSHHVARDFRLAQRRRDYSQDGHAGPRRAWMIRDGQDRAETGLKMSFNILSVWKYPVYP